MNSDTDATTIMISGQMSVTKDQFNKYYKPRIDSFIKDNKNEKPVTFLVGGAKGTDMLAQEYLRDKVGDGKVRVIVNDIIGEYNVLDKKSYGHVAVCSKFTERDAYMTCNSSDDIAFITADEKSIGSGTFTNIVRRQFGATKAKQFRDWVRIDGNGTMTNYSKSPPGFSKEEMDQIVLLYKASMMMDG